MQQATRLVVGALPVVSHGSEGTQQRIIREVEDPSSGQKQDVVGIVRPGGVEHMHARGQVTDRQKAAADRFLELYERAHSDGVVGIDYSKLKVDGMAGGDVFGAAERVTRAIKDLARAGAAIGKPAYGLLVRVLVEGSSLRSIAAAEIAALGGVGSLSKRRDKLTLRLVAALDGLDHHWNVAVGAGVGIRSDMVERGEVLVETKPVDKFEGWSEEELAAHTFNVGESLKRMAGGAK